MQVSLPDAVTARFIEERVRSHVRYTLAREWEDLKPAQMLEAVALAVRDLLAEGALETERRFRAAKPRRVYYLSIEYLIGRSLSNNLRNLGIYELCATTLRRLGVELDDLLELEPDAALGNGGLGRLAACFLDSLATQGYAATGYGINYENGLFRQEIVDGRQAEQPESWRAFGSPWLLRRPEEAVEVPIGGSIEHHTSPTGRYRAVWKDWRSVLGVPSDLPIVGYGGQTVSFLRLYSAHSVRDLDLAAFDRGGYLKAVEERIDDETISRVLYPSDAEEAGRALRLRQEYFFVACAIRDIVRRFEAEHGDLGDLADYVAIQLNDTHPTLAIPEMMRLLVDDRGLGWEQAWHITERVFSYTNHTLMSEALETWPVSLMERIIPRHLLIIYEINRRFIEQVHARWPGDGGRVDRMTLVRTGSETRISMANLAVIGCHRVNGVSRLHSALLRDRLFPDFAEMWPDRFCNKTNGVTPRRWLLAANPGLARLISDSVGDRWITDLDQLQGLSRCAKDRPFRDAFRTVKSGNKERLVRVIAEKTGENVDPRSLFDVQVKRIHEYKRQLLNVLRIAWDYIRITEDGWTPPIARTSIFAGKAAIGYVAAKETIRAILSVASVVNHDPRTAEFLRVVFVPDYRVTIAEAIMPAAELSEQISLAGTEASGTGNMKMALNGALTIGTLDGANIEIREAVGPERFFHFGLTVEEVRDTAVRGVHRPHELLAADPVLARVMESFRVGRWSPDGSGVSQWVYQRLVEHGDQYMLLADFSDYVRAQDEVAALYADPDAWTEAAVHNVAGMGGFSSDRTIREYADDIWAAHPVNGWDRE